jgi:hypothetical protein
VFALVQKMPPRIHRRRRLNEFFCGAGVVPAFAVVVGPWFKLLYLATN